MNGTRTAEGRARTAVDHPHGSNTRYRNGCRCGPCRTAATEYARQVRQAKQGLPAGDPRHGTANGYDHWRCRCGPCNTAKHARRNPRQLMVAGDGDHRHGTHNGYSHHRCRCERCLSAGRAYSRAKYRRLHPVSGGAS